MEKIRIITDSASDITYENEKALDIKILPFQVALGDKSYTSRVDFDNDGFYELMAQYDEIPKTSQITPYEFQELYLQEAEAGYTDLILVLINSHGSATYGNSLMAKDLFFEEHPEYQGKVNIYNIDGKGYSAIYGAPVVRGAEMVREGKTAADIAAYLQDAIDHKRIYFGMYTLRYAGKSGRIPSAAAFVGDRLNLKPIMKISDNEITTGAKVRGAGKLIPKIVDMSLNDMEPGTPYEIIYGSDADARDEIEAMMLEKVGYGPAGYYQIGAAIAANAGPKTVGLAFKIKEKI
jgi:DegV family protein with EDD domain